MLENVDKQLIKVLKNIQQGLQPSGYTIKTNTGTINVDDEMLSTDINDKVTRKTINYNISYQPLRRYEVSESTFAMNVDGSYTITAEMLVPEDSTHPKRDIKTTYNELVSDILYTFGNNITLNKSCNWFILNSSELIYNNNNNHLNAGKAVFNFDINITFNLQNPDLPGCY